MPWTSDRNVEDHFELAHLDIDGVIVPTCQAPPEQTNLMDLDPAKIPPELLDKIANRMIEQAAAATDRSGLRGHVGALQGQHPRVVAELRHCLRQFHIMQHANQAVDEVRRAEFFRKGARMRGVVKGKRWLLLTRWVHLTADKRQ